MAEIKIDKYSTQKISVAITEQERVAARKLATSKGMTLQGFIADLIRKALEEYNEKL